MRVRDASELLSDWVSEHEWPALRNLSSRMNTGSGFRTISRSYSGRKAIVAVFDRPAHERPVRRATACCLSRTSRMNPPRRQALSDMQSAPIFRVKRLAPLLRRQLV